MNDYSGFINNPYGFIRKYKIDQKKGTIEVTTSKSKSNKPHVYEATPERVGQIDSRLGEQQKLINKHSKTIKSIISKVVRKKIFPISIAVAVLGLIFNCISVFTNLPLFIGNILFAVGSTSVLCTEGILNIWRHRFDKKNKIKEEFAKKSINIEKTMEQDENITRYVSRSTIQNIDDFKALKAADRIDHILINGFIDSTKLKDLKMMLEQYLIATNLTTDLEFRAPDAETPKKRQRKPKQNKRKG